MSAHHGNPRGGYCIARVLPVNPRVGTRIRPCGQPAITTIDGRQLCGRHAMIARRRKGDTSHDRRTD